MYSVVLATMMSVGGETPQFFWRCHGCRGCHCSCACSGCWGCWGCHCSGWRTCHCSGCYGSFCHGCYGCHGCWGCHGCHGVVVYRPVAVCHGCHGCYGCHGCHGCVGTVVGTAPPGGDSSLVPQNDAEREAVRRQLEQLRRKTEGPGRDINYTSASSTNNFAVVTVRMPAESKLFIDNTSFPLTSEVRTFRTPQLQQGQQYFYVLRGEIERDGQIVSQSQRVLLSAGQQVSVQFDFNSNLQTVSTDR